MMDAERMFDHVVRAQETGSTVNKGRMFGSIGLKINGKVFAMLVKGRLVVRLPHERVNALISSGAGDAFDPGHGRVSKEWVAVPPSNQREWRRLAEEAREFVASAA